MVFVFVLMVIECVCVCVSLGLLAVPFGTPWGHGVDN